MLRAVPLAPSEKTMTDKAMISHCWKSSNIRLLFTVNVCAIDSFKSMADIYEITECLERQNSIRIDSSALLLQSLGRANGIY